MLLNPKYSGKGKNGIQTTYVWLLSYTLPSWASIGDSLHVKWTPNKKFQMGQQTGQSTWLDCWFTNWGSPVHWLHWMGTRWQRRKSWYWKRSKCPDTYLHKSHLSNMWVLPAPPACSNDELLSHPSWKAGVFRLFFGSKWSFRRSSQTHILKTLSGCLCLVIRLICRLLQGRALSGIGISIPYSH